MYERIELFVYRVYLQRLIYIIKIDTIKRVCNFVYKRAFAGHNVWFTLLK